MDKQEKGTHIEDERARQTAEEIGIDYDELILAEEPAGEDDDS